MLTVGSLFAGIGGFDLGFERAGFRTVWQVEQSEFCRRVLERHFPGARRHEDVRHVGATELEPVDLICGGFPCQDISVAGLNAGIGGERSGLWSEYARIIGELRPRYVVVENVAALLGRGLGRVLGDLAALGYDAEWDCIPAIAVGAPHQRDRLWLVAYPDEGRRLADRGERQEVRRGQHAGRNGANGDLADGRARDVPDAHSERLQTVSAFGCDTSRFAPGRDESSSDVPDPEGVGRGAGREGRPPASGEGEREPERTLQDADGRALQPWRVGGRIAQAGGSEWWAAEPPVGRVAHGVPDRLDQLAALGNALVPQIAEWIGRRIIDYEEGRLAA